MTSFKTFGIYLFIVNDFSGIVFSESTCSKYQFECETGNQCITFNQLCDGKANCDDLSDETAIACEDVSCPSKTFRCLYGACISDESECNGVQDCVDNSDENSLKCPSVPETSTSKEGGLDEDQFEGKISKINCDDAFDNKKCGNSNLSTSTSTTTATISKQMTETPPSIIKTAAPKMNGHCFVPLDLPDTIQISYKSTGQEIIKGTYVAPFSAVSYKCESQYTLDGDTHNFCDNGMWNVSNHPKCIKFCPPFSGITTTAKCEFDGEIVSCSQPLKPNTIARITCASGYSKPEDRILTDVLHCDEDGLWDFQPFTCEQICGIEAPESTSLIVGGERANITKVPWHVGIYYKYQDKFIFCCGGTILNAKIVVGSAFSLYKAMAKKFMEPSDIKVVAGKYYSDFYAMEPIQSQVMNVSQTIYDHLFNDSSYIVAEINTANIVLLVLDDYIKFNSYIKPICLETDLKSYTKSVEPGIIGRFAGWGYVSPSSGKNSRTLKIIDLPTVDINECKRESIPALVLLLNLKNDKFCAGYLNGQSLCRGDIGGGLVFPKEVNGSTKYFLRGISTIFNVKLEKCDNFKYSGFTDVHHYIDMIKFYLNKTKEGKISCDDTYAKNFKICDSISTKQSEPKKDSCFIPQDVSDEMQIFYEWNPNQEIPKNSYVSPFNGITYTCKSKYTLNGGNYNFCDNGEWIFPNHPKCVKYCSPLPLNGITIKSKCEINGAEVSCMQPLQPNTTAKISCAFGYRKPVDRFVIDEIYCDEEGEWDFPTFRCEQICGTEVTASESTSLTIGVNVPNVTNQAPWHVGIYSNVLDKDYFDQICGGTILNSKVVISAAHCFWNNKTVFEPSNFKVAAGKYYRDLYATEQLSPQILNVAQINYNQDYNDNAGFYGLDFAVLVLVEHIEFKSYIKPICVETGLTFNEKNIEPGMIGSVAGWSLVSSAGKSSPELKIVDLTAIEYNECKRKLSTDLKLFLTSDKFCAGYTNGMTVCGGDSGGGLVFPKMIGGNKVYFLRGIVSAGGAKPGACDNYQYTLFTNIQYHIEMITFYESQNRSK